jgi:hypothetical protein
MAIMARLLFSGKLPQACSQKSEPGKLGRRYTAGLTRKKERFDTA